MILKVLIALGFACTTVASNPLEKLKLKERALKNRDADWCKFEKSYLGGGYASYPPTKHKSLAEARVACLSNKNCAGVVGYGTKWTLRKGKIAIPTKRRETAYLYCEDNDFKQQFNGKLAVLKAKLENKINGIESLTAMEDFAKNDDNTLTLLQWRLLNNIKENGDILNYNDPTFQWIMNNKEALEDLTLSGSLGYKYNSWKRAITSLRDLINVHSDAKSGRKLKLAVGTALAFSRRIEASANRSRTIDMKERYNSYIKWEKEGVLFDVFKTLNVWQYRFVLGSWFEDSELVWARANALEKYRNPNKIGDVTFKMVKYKSVNDYGVSVQKKNDYYADMSSGKKKIVEVTLKRIHEVGGVCGAVSGFGVGMANAFGVPALAVFQEYSSDKYSGHSAFIWYKNGTMYLTNDVSGWNKTHAKKYAWNITDRGSAIPMMDLAQKNPHYRLTEKMRLATEFKSDETEAGLKFKILEYGTELCPENYPLWVDLTKILKYPVQLKDASDYLLGTVKWLRDEIVKDHNLAPECSVTASEDFDHATNIVDKSDRSLWTAKKTTAWFELDMGGECKISSLELKWWGLSASRDYDILIKGKNTGSKFLQILGDKDETSKPADFNGYSKFSNGWKQITSKIRFQLRNGKLDPWGKHVYFGIRQLKIIGVLLDKNVVISKAKYTGSRADIDFVDICSLNSVVVKHTGTKVIVSASTDGKTYKKIGEKSGSGNIEIPLTGLATNLRIKVKKGSIGSATVSGIRYTVKDILKIKLEKDLASNLIMMDDLKKMIDAAG